MSSPEPPVATEDPGLSPEPLPPSPRPSGRQPSAIRRALPWLGLVALAVSAAVGGNLFGLRDGLSGSETRQPKAPAASRSAGAAPATSPAPETLVRSHPWWQEVGRLEGRGTSSEPLAIDEGAIQWRVRAVCETGRLVVSVADRPKPVLESPCAGAETPVGYGTKTGALSLKVTADGPWQLHVEQQVDVPLVEPPLPSMSAPGTVVVATAALYRMDQTGTGELTVYRLADGSHLLRLDDFFVSPNVDLELTFSPLEAPRSTQEFMGSPWVKAAPLDITAGSLNFTVPAGVDPTKYKSMVVWCPIINSAYSGATLVFTPS